jgi:hypothetical protein
MSEWPRNWDELTRGIGCEMCEDGRPATPTASGYTQAGIQTHTYSEPMFSVDTRWSCGEAVTSMNRPNWTKKRLQATGKRS